MTATPPSPPPTMQRDAVVTGTVLVALMAALLAAPGLQFEVTSPSARVALETLRLCVVGLAAVVLGLPYEQHGSVVRNAFVAALSVLAAASAIVGVLPSVAAEVSEAVRVSDPFYPWLASRYIAGLLFVSAAAQWPRLGVRTYVGVALAVFLIAAAALTRVQAPPAWLAPAGVGDLGAAALIGLELPPLLLFGVGAWLAARLAVHGGVPLARWLSLSLLVGVFTQLQAIRQPEVLGAAVTTTDVLRLVSTVLLLVGAMAQVRQMSRDRARVVRLQRRDLEERDAMVDMLSRYVAREDMFRAVVHHELATPVATIRAHAHVLNAAADDPARRRVAVEGIAAEAQQLHALIDRVDELRDLDATDFTCSLRPVRALPLLHEVARFTRALPGRHHVRVHGDDVRISADPVRLGQALRNVASNAVRYSPDGGSIDLTGTRVGDGRYRLSVSDEGIGIDADGVGALLAFAGRGRNTAGTEGSGIGLYIARRIADAHGGRLIIEPMEPTGTRVTLEVDVA